MVGHEEIPISAEFSDFLCYDGAGEPEFRRRLGVCAE